jgi:uncharacterized surface protein with fasciclin (FAS1) repeats
LDALNQTGVLSELDARSGPITILAPDDNAFKDRTFTREQLNTIVRQHVLVDYLAYTPLLQDQQVYPTLGGGEVVISVDDKGAVSLGGARILAGDAILTNGAVHTIDRVRLCFYLPRHQYIGSLMMVLITISCCIWLLTRAS